MSSEMNGESFHWLVCHTCENIGVVHWRHQPLIAATELACMSPGFTYVEANDNRRYRCDQCLSTPEVLKLTPPRRLSAA